MDKIMENLYKKSRKLGIKKKIIHLIKISKMFSLKTNNKNKKKIKLFKQILAKTNLILTNISFRIMRHLYKINPDK